MAPPPPDPGWPPPLATPATTTTPMVTVLVTPNGIPTPTLVPATGTIRAPLPSSSSDPDSEPDTNQPPAATPLNPRQLRSKLAADKFLARHDRIRATRAATRPLTRQPSPSRLSNTHANHTATPTPYLSEDDKPIRPRPASKPSPPTTPPQALPSKSAHGPATYTTKPTTPTSTKTIRSSSTQSSLPAAWLRTQKPDNTTGPMDLARETLHPLPPQPLLASAPNTALATHAPRHHPTTPAHPLPTHAITIPTSNCLTPSPTTASPPPPTTATLLR
ncbi:hypothetical protein H257_09065 [Aphanomyces astaci]|uniref:Uncharacterized protein n=1 Tax=Aphanomyces astaci TaxID=112090 RepID=W4GDN7_APHAT|nr:hypothetical protein H257_09065 [Aphanomyces astaci]ETV77179.1 hypothetical protein H257_09065 [Aphanomyces astaci]|eukprot:XP_009833485.1 hypothetical protein H257_09065 [Aphanomyces astaci]